MGEAKRRKEREVFAEMTPAQINAAANDAQGAANEFMALLGRRTEQWKSEGLSLDMVAARVMMFLPYAVGYAVAGVAAAHEMDEDFLARNWLRLQKETTRQFHSALDQHAAAAATKQ